MFYPGDLVSRTGEQEIRSVYGRLPDDPGELAQIKVVRSCFVCNKLEMYQTTHADSRRYISSSKTVVKIRRVDLSFFQHCTRKRFLPAKIGVMKFKAFDVITVMSGSFFLHSLALFCMFFYLFQLLAIKLLRCTAAYKNKKVKQANNIISSRNINENWTMVTGRFWLDC